ncbi:hypothetical protein IT568_04220 [bacterium]|nr:hypothetical protein [bacterium]
MKALIFLILTFLLLAVNVLLGSQQDQTKILKALASDSISADSFYKLLDTLKVENQQKILESDSTAKKILENVKKFTGSDSIPLDSVKKRVFLKSYEPNLIGYTFDSDDEPFLEAKISLMFPLDWQCWREKFGTVLTPYFAVTTRFGQYIGTRKSSPVVGKQFKPKLFLRFDPGKFWKRLEYFDFGYGHESNGQDITDSLQFKAKDDFEDKRHGKDTDYAKDFLSRSWNYWDFELKIKTGDFSFYPSLTLFNKVINKEEYKSWENDTEGKPRNQVDGVKLIVKYEKKLNFGKNQKCRIKDFFKSFKELKTALIFTTGYKKIGSYKSYKGEVALTYENLPVMFWFFDGYGNDLAQYYKKSKSWGVALELKTFKTFF